MKSDTLNSQENMGEEQDKQEVATETADGNKSVETGSAEVGKAETDSPEVDKAEADRWRRQWIEDGEMNGDDADTIQALYQFLPTKNSISAGPELKHWEVAQGYMAELWLRGVSKERFMKETGLDKVDLSDCV